MNFTNVIDTISDVLKEIDSKRLRHKSFRPGIGPFGEPQIVREISQQLSDRGIPARTQRTPDLSLGDDWAIEFKIARPFGDNGLEAEDWSVNLLHPYPGNTSLLGDGLKLLGLRVYAHLGLVVIGYEHDPAKISLDPLLISFELLAGNVMKLNLSKRVERRVAGLVHPEHQVLRCVGWEVHRG